MTAGYTGKYAAVMKDSRALHLEFFPLPSDL